MAQLDRDIVFGALTRPQMFAGVTYSYFVLNAVIVIELFLITHSFWVLPAALVIHLIGYLGCLKEPRRRRFLAQPAQAMMTQSVAFRRARSRTWSKAG